MMSLFVLFGFFVGFEIQAIGYSFIFELFY